MRDWRPSSDVRAAQRRAEIVGRLRHRFSREKVLEVSTPALSAFAVSDTHIESLTVASALQRAPLFLHTSPEFFMKRLLAAGYPDIYSICRVFRDGEAGRKHQPEFTIVEWYRLGFDLGEIIDDTVATILAALGDAVTVDAVNRVDYRDAIVEACGLDPFTAPLVDIANRIDADASLRETLGDHRDDWLDLLLSEYVIPGFADDQLTVLQHYPASQAALARLSPGDPSVADRFEVFLGAVELANGYVELTDVAEQHERIERDQAQRQQRGLPLRPPDIDFLAALDNGLPACAGVAMGLERLQMVHDNTDDIRDVVTFAFGINHD